jgi:malonyl-CoA/methylmalonyl-CoA synthetase
MYRCIESSQLYPQKIAVVDRGESVTYQQLANESARLGSLLLGTSDDLAEARVAFMVPPGKHYVASLWAIWRAGGVAVPLCLTYPLPSLQFVLEDTGARSILITRAFESVLGEYCAQQGIRLMVLEELTEQVSVLLPDISSQRRALILYTSGTTSKPKGVVTTHANITAQVTTLINAWGWNASDATLCVLPLHHVHGIINVVSCSLYAGATCYFTESFSAEEVFQWLTSDKLTVFMAVPTIYYKLINYWETLSDEAKSLAYQKILAFRLMVCGSAALPVTVMEKWEMISGQVLLERYGMTEIGMAISNPYVGERRAGYVGVPLPGVEVKLVDEKGSAVADGEPGEIIIRGPNVFLEYWQNPQATAESFTEAGWFSTGDVAVVENGYYRIMGRMSMDIIKSGGYKISALEIEEVLRTHPAVDDCAVIGMPDEEWGELIVAALVLKEPSFDTHTLQLWLSEKMAAYKTPRKYLVLPELPRNAMGKVVKSSLKQLFA